MSNFLEFRDSKLVYRRYASLFFVAGIHQDDNELATLEIIHRYVEVLDRYFGNVCELDLIFNFQKAYSVGTVAQEAIALSREGADLARTLVTPRALADPRRTHHIRRDARVIKEVGTESRQPE